MNTRLANLILLAISLGLMGTLAFTLHLLYNRPQSPDYLTQRTVVTNTVTQIAVRKINPTNLLAALANRVLHWQAIESTNYQTYIANLRTIGCPEETIRDIIIADVSKLYARRRAALTEKEPYRFWRSGISQFSPETRRELQALEAEKRELVQELLGVDYRVELGRYMSTGLDTDARAYDFLPEEKRTQLLAIEEKYRGQQEGLYSQVGGLLLPEDHAEWQRLEQQKQQELAALLSADEMHEYELRFSPTSEALRTGLDGFEPSEEEFRRIFSLQQVYDEEFAKGLETVDAASPEAHALAEAAAQRALNEELRKTLGEERYSSYVRALDPDYQNLVQLTQRLDLPEQLAGRVYTMKQEAERQKQRVENNVLLTEEQRQNALAAIARETERSIATVMGERPFRTYRDSSGHWLDALSEQPEIPPDGSTP